MATKVEEHEIGLGEFAVPFLALQCYMQLFYSTVPNKSIFTQALEQFFIKNDIQTITGG